MYLSTRQKLFILILCFALTLGIIPVNAEQIKLYSDLSEKHWAYKAISEMSKLRIISGNPDGTFKPDDPVSREQFAKMMVLAMNLQSINPDKPTFKDIGKDHWAYVYVETAKGFLTGYQKEDGLYYEGSQNAVREDIAYALVKAKGYGEDRVDTKTFISNFKDADEVSGELLKHVSVAYEQKLVSGYPDNTFRPNGILTRAQAAQLLYNASVKVNSNGEKIPVPEINEVPLVVSTSPANGEVGVKLNTNIEITFSAESEVVSNQDTMDLAVLVLDHPEDKRDNHEGITKKVGPRTVMHSVKNLQSNKQYYIKVVPGVVKDKYGNINPEYVFSFTTGNDSTIEEEPTEPKVVSTQPKDEDKEVKLNPSIQIEFSKGCEVLKDQDELELKVMLLESQGEKEDKHDGIIKKLAPNILQYYVENLEPNKKYYVKVLSGAAMDKYGNPSPEYMFSFTTEDVEVPEVISTIPGRGDNDVSLNPEIKIIFGPGCEVISNQGDLDSKVLILEDPDDTEEEYQGTTRKTGFNTLVHKVEDLKPDKEYYVKVMPGTARDENGNGNIEFIFSFRTKKADYPMVVATTPENEDEEVDTSPEIRIEFSEGSEVTDNRDVLQNAVFVMESPDGERENYECSTWKESSNVLVHKVKGLAHNKTYYIKVNPGAASDDDGNSNREYTFSFTTEN